IGDPVVTYPPRTVPVRGRPQPGLPTGAMAPAGTVPPRVIPYHYLPVIGPARRQRRPGIPDADGTVRCPTVGIPIIARIPQEADRICRYQYPVGRLPYATLRRLQLPAQKRAAVHARWIDAVGAAQIDQPDLLRMRRQRGHTGRQEKDSDSFHVYCIVRPTAPAVGRPSSPARSAGRYTVLH